MSASAPLGTPSRNTGSVDADCTSATMMGDGLSEVMSQAAATSFIHMQTLAATHTPHSMRNTGLLSGVQADTVATGGTGARGWGSGGVALMRGTIPLVALSDGSQCPQCGRAGQRCREGQPQDGPSGVSRAPRCLSSGRS